MKAYKIKENTQKKSKVVIAIIAAIMLLFFIVTEYFLSILLPVLIMLIFLYYWHSKNPVITLNEYYIESKFSPLQKTTLVKYNTITDLKYSEKKKIVLLFSEGKKIKIPVGGIETDGAEEVVSFLREQVQQNNIVA